MGDWHISIHGVGCHDSGAPYDAEALAKEFVATLRAQGHTIKSAYVNIGGATPQQAGLTHSSEHTHDILEGNKSEREKIAEMLGVPVEQVHELSIVPAAIDLETDPSEPPPDAPPALCEKCGAADHATEAHEDGVAGKDGNAAPIDPPATEPPVEPPPDAPPS